MDQLKLEANTCNRHEARENVRERVTIGFGFSSDWLRKWREILKPITERSNSEPKQTQFTFDTQVKIALFLFVCLFCFVFVLQLYGTGHLNLQFSKARVTKISVAQIGTLDSSPILSKNHVPFSGYYCFLFYVSQLCFSFSAKGDSLICVILRRENAPCIHIIEVLVLMFSVWQLHSTK